MSALAGKSRPREACSDCGFDSDLYDLADAISTQSVVPAVLAAAVEGLESEVMQSRPDESTWSIAEYLDHVREVVFGCRFAIELGLTDPGVDLGDPPAAGISGPTRNFDVAATLKEVASEYGQMHDLVDGLGADEWEIDLRLGGDDLTIGWFARHVLHDGMHHLADIGRIRHDFGHGAAQESGTVTQINVSDGGVPKLPVAAAVVGPSGIDGDSQSDRRHHGRPVQAVCLWSADVIQQLRREGHPIQAGDAGENITVADIRWDRLRPGARIQVGEVPMLITAHAIPCSKNARWFNDRDFSRILHTKNPGFSRLYAQPLASGQVSAGDPLTVEP